MSDARYVLKRVAKSPGTLYQLPDDQVHKALFERITPSLNVLMLQMVCPVAAKLHTYDHVLAIAF